jgi:hypothetical protein
MNTKLLMTMSSIITGITGLILSFLPHELLGYLNSSTGTTLDALILQILGALYFAFAMTNWTAKANLIGGIYSRPIAIGNLTHFTIGALALIKGYSSSHNIIFQASTLVYTVFAILFGVVFFRHPVADK